MVLSLEAGVEEDATDVDAIVIVAGTGGTTGEGGTKGLTFLGVDAAIACRLSCRQGGGSCSVAFETGKGAATALGAAGLIGTAGPVLTLGAGTAGALLAAASCMAGALLVACNAGAFAGTGGAGAVAGIGFGAGCAGIGFGAGAGTVRGTAGFGAVTRTAAFVAVTAGAAVFIAAIFGAPFPFPSPFFRSFRYVSLAFLRSFHTL